MEKRRQQSLFDLLQEENNSSPGPPGAMERLETLRKACLECTGCALRGGCRQVVFGEGNARARLMLVGEGPGADEDRLGRPFVGPAGRLLDRILEAAGLVRDELYIANVVKCRPPGNRLPLQPEVDRCVPYLRQQIELVDPRVIVCLGALAARTLIDRNASITALRGRWHRIDGRRYLPTFHPAALLRDSSKKRPVWEDFKELVSYFNMPENGGGADEQGKSAGR